jgi:GrpB-like predicted nucleotidyltransferase (UPF0157 family)
MLKAKISQTERNKALMPVVQQILKGKRDAGDEVHFVDAVHLLPTIIRIYKVLKRKAQLWQHEAPSIYVAAKMHSKIERVYEEMKHETPHTTYQAAVREYLKRTGKEWEH